MAVLGRLLISSAERFDLPDLLSMDSYAAGDWKYFIKGMIGSSKPYILKGFDVIDPQAAIGTQGCSIRVSDSMVLFPESKAGPFFHGLSEGHPLAQPIVPELRKNSVNYVYLTLSTFNTSVDTRAFWDPDKDGGNGGEFTQDVNTESVLKVEVNVSTGSFPVNTIPVAKVTVGPVVITAIEDARDLMFRLGSGGVNPDPFNKHSFRSLPGAGYKRTEPPTTITTASDPNPFQGADKNIQTLKEWMDVVMTKLLELGGTNYWYEDASTFNLVNLFSDSMTTTIQSKGSWLHDSTTEGLLTWSEDIQIKNIVDKRDVIIRAGNKTLNNEQVMYLVLQRDLSINTGDVAVTWTNGFNYVNGITNSFQNLAKGDWIKKHDDSNTRHLRVEEFYAGTNLSGGTTTAALARSIKLSETYQGTSESKKAVYTRGVYTTSDISVVDRANSALELAGGELHWLAMRSDIINQIGTIETVTLTGDISESNGSTAKFTAASAHGLIDGDRVVISGTTGYNGTHVVEVEDATSFYFSAAGLTNPTGISAYYGLVTTAARSTVDGLQLESANHGFESGNKIQIAGTANFDGAYLINKHSATAFNVPIAGALATENAGTATLARIDVKSESGIERVIRGESKEIAGSVTSAIMGFIGMLSETQSTPAYTVSSSYNAINGYHNYNSLDTDSLTARVSKLTSMMADRVQDRDLKLVGRVTIKNETSGPNQVISGSGTLRVEKPGAVSQNINLSCNLPTNSAAVMSIDRNGGSAISLQVKTLGTPYLLEENNIVLFYRLSDTTVYAWDGSQILANATYTPFNPEDAQNKNIMIYNPGNMGLNAGSGLVTFKDNDADIQIIVPGTTATNTVDVSAINTLGTFVMSANDAAWVRVDRVANKTFSVIEMSDVADTNLAGAIYVTPLATVPVDQDVVVLFTRIGDTLIQSKIGIAPASNVYEETLSVVSGAAVDDNEISGPVIAGTDLTLPFDSRDSNSAQEYLIGAGLLEVYLNGQLLRMTDDWTEIGAPGSLSSIVRIQQQLEIGDVLIFRIDTQGGVFITEGAGGGGASDSLQSAYNTGRIISIASGQPVVITGPAGQKLIQINGDMDVAGVIDPTGITFTPQTSTPLQPTDHGLWVDTSGDLIHQRGNALTELNMTELLTNLSSGETTSAAIQNTFDNNSGISLSKLTPVRITNTGEVADIDVSLEAEAFAVAGVVAADIADGSTGYVVSSGRIKDISTTATFGDVLYISKSGGTTNTKPSDGVGGFATGDYVIKLGVVAKNETNPLNKDLLLNIQVVGQL